LRELGQEAKLKKHTCTMTLHTEGIGYPDLDDLISKPCDLEFIIGNHSQYLHLLIALDCTYINNCLCIQMMNMADENENHKIKRQVPKTNAVFTAVSVTDIIILSSMYVLKIANINIFKIISFFSSIKSRK
jgi:hypothetical protein